MLESRKIGHVNPAFRPTLTTVHSISNFLTLQYVLIHINLQLS